MKEKIHPNYKEPLFVLVVRRYTPVLPSQVFGWRFVQNAIHFLPANKSWWILLDVWISL